MTKSKMKVDVLYPEMHAKASEDYSHLVPIGSFVASNKGRELFGNNIVNLWESGGEIYMWNTEDSDRDNYAEPYDIGDKEAEEYIREVILSQRNIYEMNLRLEVD